MSSYLSNSQSSRDVGIIAQELVSKAISMGLSFIQADPLGFFVYKDPAFDDVRPDRRSEVNSRRPSRKDSRLIKDSNQSIGKKDDTENVVVKRISTKTIKSRATFHSRLTKYNILPQYSDTSLTSKRYSYIMSETVQRESNATTASNRRSTFENIVFRQKTKQSEQETLWNYAMSDSATDSEESEDDIANINAENINSLQYLIYELQTLENFDINTTINTVRDFVSLWKLSPTTKFSILKDVPVTKGILGDKYHVTVAFSQPTNMCPNPLAVAHVYFDINYSFVMPLNYPIMISYRFETYRNYYRIMGQRNMRSITFQNYFIETILNAKLSFYTELFEATHGPLNQTPKKFSDEEEYEMHKIQIERNHKLTVKNKVKDPTSELLGNIDAEKAAGQSMTLLSFTNNKNYSLLMGREEPWKLGFIDTGKVDKVHLSIQLENETLETPMKNHRKSKKNFDLNFAKDETDIFLPK